ncbi:MAG: hypothetical protein V1768_03085 [Patescibacteria group bacterium]
MKNGHKIILIISIALVILIGIYTSKSYISDKSIKLFDYKEFEPTTVSWSPSGGSVSYINYNIDYKSRSHLYEKDIKTFSKKEIINSGELPFVTVGRNKKPAYAWSPDGNRVAYALMSETGKNQIKIYNLITNKIKDITPDFGIFNVVEWSPDGKSILLYDGHGTPKENKYYIINSDGTNLKELFDNSISPYASEFEFPIVYWFNDSNYLHLYALDKSTYNFNLFGRFNLKNMQFERGNSFDINNKICGNPINPKVIKMDYKLISPDGKHFLELKRAFSIDPLDSRSRYDLKLSKTQLCSPLDTDLDGIPNYLDEDIDGDGFSNYDEINQGTSILDKNEHPSQAIETSKPNPKLTPIPISTNQNKNYLAIKEWGVQFEKPTGLNDLQYVIFDNTGNIVAFTTQQLVNLDKSTGGKYCTADQDPIGTLSRVQNFDIYTQNGRDIPTNVQIGSYYYFFTGPQATCSDNKQVQALESIQISTLQTIILKSLKVTP